MEHAMQADLLSGEWDPAEGGSLQESNLRNLLDDYPGAGRTIRNHTERLVVTSAEVDRYGGFVLEFEQGYRLVAFPSATRGEMWRVFPDSPVDEHFVMEA
jgi:hypothetical protein